MLLGLSTGQKLALLVAAGAFIGFALAASFWFPRRNPDFPGYRLGSFIALTVVLLVGMLSAVVVFAKEDEAEAEGHGEVLATETAEEREEGPGATSEETTGETGGGTGETGSETSGEARGDAEAGEAVFASAGCGGCHTLSDAGSSGTVGPNLDESQPSYELAVERVTNGAGAMPPFRDDLTEKQIRDVSAYVVEASGS